jgi:hypothetical protein
VVAKHALTSLLVRGCGFGVKTIAHYRGLKKNTAQLITLFVLSHLWMVRSELMRVQGWVPAKWQRQRFAKENSQAIALFLLAT